MEELQEHAHQVQRVANDEADDLLIKTDNYFKNIKDLNKYKEFEVYKGKKNFYDVIEVLDTSLLASLLPFIWFYHHRLYSPLLLLIATFLLLSSIAWWLVLSAWVIITIYMSKGSMSLLRGYCLFHELKPYMKIYAESNKSVQETVRSIDKKSNYRFPFIDPPMNIEENENDKILEDKDLKTTQV